MSRKKTRFEDGSASARQDTQSDDRDGQLLPILTGRYGLERVQRAVQERICPKVHIKRWIRLAFPKRIRGIISTIGKSTNRLTNLPTPLLASALLLAQSSAQVDLNQFVRPSDKSEGEQEHGSSVESPIESSEKEEPEQQVLVYLRVSTAEQEENGQSLDSMEEELLAILDGMSETGQFGETIIDGGESGTDFDREGIQKVARLAQLDEVTHLIVDTIDRIGRTAPETLMFIDQLRDEYDVKLLCRGEEFDMFVPGDRIEIIMRATMAEFSTMNRARSSTRSSADNFLKNKQWSSWFRDNIPLGYRSSGDWIEPVEEWIPIIEETYTKFIEERGYSATADKINEQFEEELERRAQLKGKELDRTDIKSIVTNPVYIGKPTIQVDYLQHYGKNPSHEDENLAFVDEDVFNAAQEAVAELREKYSRDESKEDTAKDYVDQFSPYIVESVSPMVRLQCPVCDEPLVSNGQQKLRQEQSQRIYRCQNENCEFGDQRWPTESELDMMRMLHRCDELHGIL